MQTTDTDLEILVEFLKHNPQIKKLVTSYLKREIRQPQFWLSIRNEAPHLEDNDEFDRVVEVCHNEKTEAALNLLQ